MTADKIVPRLTTTDHTEIERLKALVDLRLRGILEANNGYQEQRHLDQCIEHLANLSTFLNKLLNPYR